MKEKRKKKERERRKSQNIHYELLVEEVGWSGGGGDKVDHYPLWSRLYFKEVFI